MTEKGLGMSKVENIEVSEIEKLAKETVELQKLFEKSRQELEDIKTKYFLARFGEEPPTGSIVVIHYPESPYKLEIWYHFSLEGKGWDMVLPEPLEDPPDGLSWRQLCNYLAIDLRGGCWWSIHNYDNVREIPVV